MKTSILTRHLILFCTLLSLRAAHGAAFTNGSFELPGGLAPHSTLSLALGNTSLVGWTIGGVGGIAYDNGSNIFEPYNPVDGAYHVAFNGGDQAPGTFLSQTFDTVVGQQYFATFFVGRYGPGVGNPGIGAMSLTASALSAGNSSLASLQVFPPLQGYGSMQSLSFIPTSSTTTLKFTDTSLVTTSVDVLLDNIVVSTVPEPSTLGLAAFVALLVAARRVLPHASNS